jgi:ADP-ribosylation factor 1/2
LFYWSIYPPTGQKQKMGNLFFSWTNYFNSFTESKITVLGLDCSGKSTLLYKIKNNSEVVDTVPMIGYSTEELKLGKLSFKAMDVGGRERISTRLKFHSLFLSSSNALIWMIDSNDIERFKEVKENLDAYLNHEMFQHSPVLFFANKQDLPNAKNCTEIVDFLKLSGLKQNWMIQPCVMTTGEGLQQGFDWLSKQLKQE